MTGKSCNALLFADKQTEAAHSIMGKSSNGCMSMMGRENRGMKEAKKASKQASMCEGIHAHIHKQSHETAWKNESIIEAPAQKQCIQCAAPFFPGLSKMADSVCMFIINS